MSNIRIESADDVTLIAECGVTDGGTSAYPQPRVTEENGDGSYVLHVSWPEGEVSAELLAEVYRRCLKLCADRRCSSVVFPLLREGTQEVTLLWRTALKTCIDFIYNNTAIDIEIIFAAASGVEEGRRELERLENERLEMLLSGEDEECPDCDGIVKAIDEWMQGDKKNGVIITEALVEALKKDVHVLVPVANDDEVSGKDKLGVRAMASPDGTFVIPVFTSLEELKKAGNSSHYKMSLSAVMTRLMLPKPCKGLIINPAGNSVTVPKNTLPLIMKLSRPKTPAENMLAEGTSCYKIGEYDKAVALFKASAELGNMQAMGKLGFCCYYGRGVMADKAQARLCWEKAAMLGDALAMYKMGDMLRNGDLPQDIACSNMLYKKAHDIAAATMNVDILPEICIRLLKYCAEDFPKKRRMEMAMHTVKLLEIRVLAGDVFAQPLLDEARQIQLAVNSEQ